MPTITRVTTGNASIDDLNQLIELLEGTSGYELAFLLRCIASSDFKIRLADAAGVREFIIQDSAGVSVATIDSDGNMAISGSFAPTTLLAPSTATPTQTTEGEMKWHSTDDLPTFGTGAATKYIGLSRGAGLDASATKELMYDTTNRLLKVWNGSASISAADFAPTRNYKSSAQAFTTDTAFANVVGALASTFSFSIAASEVWDAEYWIPVTFGGTGGLKLQLTGPAAPTSVQINGTDTRLVNVSTTDNLSVSIARPFTAVTAFSSSFIAIDSVATSVSADAGKFLTSATNIVHIKARIINGANAGSVVLQAAQNSSNSTTTLTAGAWMKAERIA